MRVDTHDDDGRRVHLDEVLLPVVLDELADAGAADAARDDAEREGEEVEQRECGCKPCRALARLSGRRALEVQVCRVDRRAVAGAESALSVSFEVGRGHLLRELLPVVLLWDGRRAQRAEACTPRPAA